MRDDGGAGSRADGRKAVEQEGKRRVGGGLIVESVGGGKGLADRLFEI